MGGVGLLHVDGHVDGIYKEEEEEGGGMIIFFFSRM
jgi:hypothetical protein